MANPPFPAAPETSTSPVPETSAPEYSPDEIIELSVEALTAPTPEATSVSTPPDLPAPSTFPAPKYSFDQIATWTAEALADEPAPQIGTEAAPEVPVAASREYTLEEMEFQKSAFVDDTPEIDHRDFRYSKRLQKLQRAQTKREGLSPTDLYQGEEENSYGITEDGYQESLRNKVMNDYSVGDLFGILKEINDEQGAVIKDGVAYKAKRDEAGNLVKLDKYIGEFSSFYAYKTKDGNIKFGKWDGLNPDDRYSKEYLSQYPGAEGANGVDTNQQILHYVLPASVVDLMEGLVHGNKTLLQHRVARLPVTETMGEDGKKAYDVSPDALNEYRAQKALYGSGLTEIYTPFTAKTSGADKAQLYQEFLHKYQPGALRSFHDPDAISAYDKVLLETGGTFGDRAVNTLVAAPLATFTKSVIVEPAVAVAELFGADLESTEEDRAKAVDRMFGYKSIYSQAATQRVTGSVEKIYKNLKAGKEADFDDVLDILGTVVSNPELISTSLTSSLGILLGLGKFTKVGKVVSGIEKQLKAGEITAAAAKTAVAGVKANHSLLQNTSYLLAKNAGYASTLLGAAASNIKAFKENNGGDVTVTDALRVTAMTAAMLSIDKMATGAVLKNIPGVKQVLDTPTLQAARNLISNLPANMYVNAVKHITKPIISAGLEGSTEFVQSFGELISQQYASKKYGSDVAKLIANEANQIEALTGLSIGAVAGGAFSGIDTGFKMLGGISSPFKTKEGGVSTTPTNPEAALEAEAKEKFNEAASALKVIGDSDSGVTQDNLGEVLHHLQTARDNEEVAVRTGKPDGVKKAQEAIASVREKAITAIEALPAGTSVEDLIRAYVQKKAVENKARAEAAAQAAASAKTSPKGIVTPKNPTPSLFTDGNAVTALRGLRTKLPESVAVDFARITVTEEGDKKTIKGTDSTSLLNAFEVSVEADLTEKELFERVLETAVKNAYTPKGIAQAPNTIKREQELTQTELGKAITYRVENTGNTYTELVSDIVNKEGLDFTDNPPTISSIVTPSKDSESEALSQPIRNVLKELKSKNLEVPILIQEFQKKPPENSTTSSAGVTTLTVPRSTAAKKALEGKKENTENGTITIKEDVTAKDLAEAISNFYNNTPVTTGSTQTTGSTANTQTTSAAADNGATPTSTVPPAATTSTQTTGATADNKATPTSTSSNTVSKETEEAINEAYVKHIMSNLMADIIDKKKVKKADGEEELPEATISQLTSVLVGKTFDAGAIKAFIKNYIGVQKEIDEGARGINTRKQILLRNKWGKNPSVRKLLNTQYKEILEWVTTTQESIKSLEEGIQLAERMARNPKSYRELTGVTTHDLKTKYNKAPTGPGKKGEAFAIRITKSGDTWIVHKEEAEKRIEAKKKTYKALMELVNEYHKDVKDVLDKPIYTDGFNIPIKTVIDAKTAEVNNDKQVKEKGRDRNALEVDYFNNAKKVLADLFGITAPVVYAITSDGGSKLPKWNTNGERARSNLNYTNIVGKTPLVAGPSTDPKNVPENNPYSAPGAVAYISAPTVTTIPGGKNKKEKSVPINGILRKNDAGYADFQKAVEAKAPIVLDIDMVATGNQKVQRATNNLVAYLTKKGYVRVGIVNDQETYKDNPAKAIFVHKDAKARDVLSGEIKFSEEIVGEYQSSQKQKTKEARERKTRRANLVKIFTQLQAIEQGYLTGIPDGVQKELQQAYDTLYETVAEEFEESLKDTNNLKQEIADLEGPEKEDESDNEDSTQTGEDTTDDTDNEDVDVDKEIIETLEKVEDEAEQAISEDRTDVEGLTAAVSTEASAGTAEDKRALLKKKINAYLTRSLLAEVSRHGNKVQADIEALNDTNPGLAAFVGRSKELEEARSAEGTKLFSIWKNLALARKSIKEFWKELVQKVKEDGLNILQTTPLLGGTKASSIEPNQATKDMLTSSIGAGQGPKPVYNVHCTIVIGKGKLVTGQKVGDGKNTLELRGVDFDVLPHKVEDLGLYKAASDGKETRILGSHIKTDKEKGTITISGVSPGDTINLYTHPSKVIEDTILALDEAKVNSLKIGEPYQKDADGSAARAVIQELEENDQAEKDAKAARKTKLEQDEQAIKDIMRDLGVSNINEDAPAENAQVNSIQTSVNNLKADRKAQKDAFARLDEDQQERARKKDLNDLSELFFANRLHSRHGATAYSVTVHKVSKIETNTTEYVKVADSKATPLSTLSLDTLPTVLYDMAKDVEKALNKIIPRATDTEKQWDFLGNKGKSNSDIFKLINSPSRSLLLDKDGKIQEVFYPTIAAVLSEFIKNHAGLMRTGYKEDSVVMQMFGLSQAAEITQEHRKVANENGMLFKTFVNSTGAALLKTLNLSSNTGDDIHSEQWNILKADLGGVIYLVAKELKLIDENQVPSNELAKLYERGEVRDPSSTGEGPHTKFVQLKTVPGERELTGTVEAFLQNQEKLDEIFPDLTGAYRDVYFRPPTEEEMEELIRETQNTSIGEQPSEEAKDTLKHNMRTPYKLNLEGIRDFRKLYEKPETEEAVLSSFGWVKIHESNPKYQEMMYDDKIKQESINDKIERDIKFLLQTAATIENSRGDIPNEVYFGWYFILNHRFNMEQNTLQPQGTHLHRWFVQPIGFEVTLEVEPKGQFFHKRRLLKRNWLDANPTATTEEKQAAVQDPDNLQEERADLSLFVRAALGQAFGGDIDKVATTVDLPSAISNVTFGNILLNLPANALEDIKKAVITQAEFTIEVDSNLFEDSYFESPAERPATVELTIKTDPGHIGQTLTALQFIKDYHASIAQGGSGTIKTSLSAEYDATTSGFANKLAQVSESEAVANENDLDLPTALRSLGLVTQDDMKTVQDVVRDKGGVGSAIGMNDVRALFPDFLDSYETQAKHTLEAITDALTGEELSSATYTEKSPAFRPTVTAGSQTKDSTDKKLYDALKPFLPTEDITGKVSTEMRKLFKNPFMIFNYAAQITTIVKNLTFGLATDVLREISTASEEDIDNPESDVNKLFEAIQENLKSGEALFVFTPSSAPKGKGERVKITKLEELQKALQTAPLDNIYIANSSGKPSKKRPLYELFEKKVLTPLYGKAVEHTFNKRYKSLVTLNSVINDTFALGFALFDNQFKERLKLLTKTKGQDYVVTQADIDEIMEKLLFLFPSIPSPISDKNNLYTNVGVYATQTGRLNSLKIATRPAQISWKEGSKTRNLTTNPIVRALVAAVSAGAVIPLHAIEGAAIQKTTEKSIENASIYEDPTPFQQFLPIHDATVVSLAATDSLTHSYGASLLDIKNTYNYVAEVLKFGETLLTYIKEDNSDKESTTGVKINEDELETEARTWQALKAAGPSQKAEKTTVKGKKDFTKVLESTLKTLTRYTTKVGSEHPVRELWRTSIFMPMIASPGSAIDLAKGVDSVPNTDYLQDLTPGYEGYKEGRVEYVPPPAPAPTQSKKSAETKAGPAKEEEADTKWEGPDEGFQKEVEKKLEAWLKEEHKELGAMVTGRVILVYSDPKKMRQTTTTMIIKGDSIEEAVARAKKDVEEKFGSKKSGAAEQSTKSAATKARPTKKEETTTEWEGPDEDFQKKVEDKLNIWLRPSYMSTGLEAPSISGYGNGDLVVSVTNKFVLISPSDTFGKSVMTPIKKTDTVDAVVERVKQAAEKEFGSKKSGPQPITRDIQETLKNSCKRSE